MKTLITGSTGFIGKHLVNALLGKNREIRCLVRRKSNTDIDKLKKQGVEIFYGDLLDKESLKKAVKDVKVVYHLAGEVFAKRCSDYFKTNVLGTENLLNACLSEDIVKIIHLSSIGAVGPNPDQHTLLTEETPCNPIISYGMSKYEGERVAASFYNKFGLPVVSVRPPIVYGPGQPELLNKFFIKVYQKKFLVVGNGNCLRSLCYIDNLIYGLTLVEESNKTEGKIFFIADEKVYTFNEILRTIAAEEGVEFKEKHIGEWVGRLMLTAFKILEKKFNLSLMSLYAVGTMVLNFGCDISKAKTELGYNPHIDLSEGVRRTVNSLKNLLSQ